MLDMLDASVDDDAWRACMHASYTLSEIYISAGFYFCCPSNVENGYY